MNVTAELVNERIEFTAPATARDLLLSIPGCRFGAKDRVWHAPLAWSTCMAARGVFGDGLEVGPGLDQWGAVERHQNYSIAQSKAADPCATTVSGLRDYQRGGAGFLRLAETAILADEPGTGKTIQAIAALRDAVGALPCLVVCPTAMRHTWGQELAKWAPELSVSIVAGSKAQRIKALRAGFDVYVIGWEAAKLHTRICGYGSVKLSDDDRNPGELNALGINTVILDEAHRAKNPDSKQTRAAWFLCWGARYRWALTGTPLTQGPADLWSILHALDPDSAPVRSTWVARYCDTSINWFGVLEIGGLKESTKEELFSWLDPMLLRRSKAEVLPELPPKTYSTRWVELAGGQATAYKAMKKTMMTGKLVAVDPLVQLTRLVQLASATPVVSEDGEVTALKMPSSKVSALLEMVEDAAGEPLVVFAQSRLLIELAARELDRAGVSYGLITGAVSAKDRNMAVEGFQGGHLPVILCTIGAGGEGITLHRASTAVFLQRSFSLAANLQADDRIHRIGQAAEAVNIIDLVTLGTVEERVHEIANEKEGRLQEFCRDPQWTARLLAA